MLRFWRATINTRNGLAFAIRSEQAVREELIALALALPMAWLVGATAMRRVELIAVVVLVLVVELLNTAIEKLAAPSTARPGKETDVPRSNASSSSALPSVT